MFKALFFILLSTTFCFSQDSSSILKSVKGVVIDSDTKAPLSYTNIYVLRTGKGVISNEKGFFSLELSDLSSEDSIRFQFIGYSPKTFGLNELDSSTVVHLKEKIINVGETLIFGNAPDPKSIVKKILENRPKNYRKSTSKKNVFIRKRYVNEVGKFELNLKKSSIQLIDDEMVAKMQNVGSKESAYYTDYLGEIYTSANKNDSDHFKLNPTRIVSLAQDESSEMEKLDSVFSNILKETNDGEYWKIKTGILSTKIDLDEDDEDGNTSKDTLSNLKRLKYYASEYENQLFYSSLLDEDDWEFLHKTSKYDYVLTGGTSVKGEDVYIIDFLPKGGGMFEGRMFITITTNALIRADYNYAVGKSGRDFQMLGLGYSENKFIGSIYFEKVDSSYCVKYFSKKTGHSASFERAISLIKKRERRFLDKKLNQIKTKVEAFQDMEYSFEYLVIDEQKISDSEFAAFIQPKKTPIIYVSQFDEKLWQGYSIIEPTQQMREYKK
jgi:hypothetical protein